MLAAYQPSPSANCLRKRLGAILALGLAVGAPAWAQGPTPADSGAVTGPLAAARQVYAAALGTESALYNGAEYVDYTVPGTRGHQFFLKSEPQPGTVAYRGGTFAAVPLRYDLVRDLPVLLYPGQAVAILLTPEKVAGFTLGSHRFVRIDDDSLNTDALPTGFYEVLVAGPVALLAKHSKRVYQALIGQALTLEYRQTDQLFVRTPSTTAAVTNLRKLLELLPDHQAEVQRYARQRGLGFGTDERAASAEQLLRYYYSLRP